MFALLIGAAEGGDRRTPTSFLDAREARGTWLKAGKVRESSLEIAQALDSHANRCGVLWKMVKSRFCWVGCWVPQAMAKVAEVVAGFGRGRGEWEATRGVRRVSGMYPEVAKVVVAGSGGSEGGES